MWCLHESQVCNKFAQCDPNPAKDPLTAEDEHRCDEIYSKKQIIPHDATYRCQSPHHNEETTKNETIGVVWIRAVLYDGNAECWRGEDEKNLQTDFVISYLPGFVSKAPQQGTAFTGTGTGTAFKDFLL